MFTLNTPKTILKYYSFVLVLLALAFSNCSEVDQYFPEEEVFSEVGEPILEQPVSEKSIEVEKAKLEGNQETNESKTGVANGEIGEVIEGEIVLGQTLLSTDYNESAPVINNLPPHDPSSKYKPLAYSTSLNFPMKLTGNWTVWSSIFRLTRVVYPKRSEIYLAKPWLWRALWFLQLWTNKTE